MNHDIFRKQVEKIYQAVSELEKMFPGRPFTPDGHMVGSLGECLVADAYKLKLMPPSNEGYDAVTCDGKQVEIKATQGTSVAFRSKPDHAIIIKINQDGSFEECFNGPGEIIWDTFSGRKRPKNGQYQISISKVLKLGKDVQDSLRIPSVVEHNDL